MLAAGCTPDRISYGNTIKKESEIAARLQARRHAVRGRLRGRGREGRARRARQPRDLPHPLRRHPARNGRCRASSAASRTTPPTSWSSHTSAAWSPYGISFHVGSQQHNVEAWDRALASTAAIFRTCAERGITLAHGQSRRRLPGQIRAQDAEARKPTARRSSARCASISATPSRRPSSSRAAAWSAMPA